MTQPVAPWGPATPPSSSPPTPPRPGEPYDPLADPLVLEEVQRRFMKAVDDALAQFGFKGGPGSGPPEGNQNARKYPKDHRDYTDEDKKAKLKELAKKLKGPWKELRDHIDKPKTQTEKRREEYIRFMIELAAWRDKWAGQVPQDAGPEVPKDLKKWIHPSTDEQQKDFEHDLDIIMQMLQHRSETNPDLIDAIKQALFGS